MCGLGLQPEDLPAPGDAEPGIADHLILAAARIPQRVGVVEVDEPDLAIAAPGAEQLDRGDHRGRNLTTYQQAVVAQRRRVRRMLGVRMEVQKIASELGVELPLHNLERSSCLSVGLGGALRLAFFVGGEFFGDGRRVEEVFLLERIQETLQRF